MIAFSVVFSDDRWEGVLRESVLVQCRIAVLDEGFHDGFYLFCLAA